MKFRIIISILFVYFIIGSFYAFILRGGNFDSWKWIITITCATVSVLVMIFIAAPNLQPASWSVDVRSSHKGFEIRSWAGTIIAAVSIFGFLVPYSCSVILDSAGFLPGRRSDSTAAVWFLGVFPLIYSLLLFMQIIGDGSSGIRIYPDWVELRRIGNSGWKFQKGQIEKIILFDRENPAVFIYGVGIRTDRITGTFLPDASKGELLNYLLVGSSTRAILEAFEKFGYGDKIELRRTD